MKGDSGKQKSCGAAESSKSAGFTGKRSAEALEELLQDAFATMLREAAASTNDLPGIKELKESRDALLLKAGDWMGKLLAHTERMLVQKTGMQHDRTLADRAVAAVMESLEARAAQGRIPGISMQTAQELRETAAALQGKVEESTRGIRALFPGGPEGPLSAHFLDMEQSLRRLSVTQKVLAAIVDGLSKAPSDQPADGQTEGSSRPTPAGGRRQTMADTVDSENLQKAPEQSLETLGSGKLA